MKRASVDATALKMAEAMQTDLGKEALWELFNSMDKDGNGKVSSKEWGSKVGTKKDLMAQFFGGATPAEIGQAFKRIDANGDGELMWDEFVAAARRKLDSVETAALQLASVLETDAGRQALKELFDS